MYPVIFVMSVLVMLRPSYTLFSQDMVSVVAMGGNYLLNIGPMANGMIAPVFEERLRGLAAWLGINGEAIYASTLWRVQTENSTVEVW